MKIAIEVEETTAQKCRAWCPALPGCAAVGGSRKEAQSKLREAVHGYIASLNASAPSQLELAVCWRAPTSAKPPAEGRDTRVPRRQPWQLVSEARTGNGRAAPTTLKDVR